MALKIKEDMLSAGVTPNTVTWSSLINACAHAGLVVQAFQLFEEMILSGCEPNSQCCNVLLHACVEASQYDRAFRLFRSWTGSQEGNIDSMLSTKQVNSIYSVSTTSNYITTLHNPSSVKKFSFKPTTATYNILMKACGTDYHHAKALMDEMKSLGLSPNHVSWTTLIYICGDSGNVEGAIQVRYPFIKEYILFFSSILCCFSNNSTLLLQVVSFRIQTKLCCHVFIHNAYHWPASSIFC